jgi:RNA-directed DNA polymerase
VSLDDTRPQKARQLELPLWTKGEVPTSLRSEEVSAAVNEPETPGRGGLLERVVARDNLMAALNRVRKNKGSPGVDGMKVSELADHLRVHWPRIREELLTGTYKPQAVKQKLIPKDGGKTRMLGIPTVLDRFIQQALLQVLQSIFDPTFSEHSHGFRPKRSAHDAIRAAQRYVEGGKTVVVDVDLSKFFDRVDHDILMNRVARRVADRRVLRLIRSYLTAGMRVGGIVTERREGTPQGGPLSPLLANILLDEVDKELEKRGHTFARYADDSRVFVASQRAGERVLTGLRKLYRRLKLVVNEEKSAVAPYTERPFLGYAMYPKKKGGVGLAPSEKSVQRLRATVRRMTRRQIGKSVNTVTAWLRPRLRGWSNYFKLAAPHTLRPLDQWVRRRIRALILCQWKTCKNTTRNLRKLGASPRQIRRITGCHARWWFAAGAPCHPVLTNRYLANLGLVSVGR